jgi:hypothetical protein
MKNSSTRIAFCSVLFILLAANARSDDSDTDQRRAAWNDIDYGQMGVGGDDSWEKRTLQRYSLNEKQYEYRFTLQPYTPGDGRLDQLVSRRRP